MDNQYNNYGNGYNMNNGYNNVYNMPNNYGNYNNGGNYNSGNKLLKVLLILGCVCIFTICFVVLFLYNFNKRIPNYVFASDITVGINKLKDRKIDYWELEYYDEDNIEFRNSAGDVLSIFIHDARDIANKIQVYDDDLDADILNKAYLTVSVQGLQGYGFDVNMNKVEYRDREWVDIDWFEDGNYIKIISIGDEDKIYRVQLTTTDEDRLHDLIYEIKINKERHNEIKDCSGKKIYINGVE